MENKTPCPENEIFARLRVAEGDITTLQVDAIVNITNTSLLRKALYTLKYVFRRGVSLPRRSHYAGSLFRKA